MLANKLEGAAKSAAAEQVYVEDVFSTYLYNGTGASQTITNGIDLSTKGGMVWLKSRWEAVGHQLFDTARGTQKGLDSSATSGETTYTNSLSAFNTTGFTVGVNANINTDTGIYTSWTFRKQAKFFDVVTYTGNGTTNNINHNLGSVPGCIIVKRTDTTQDWGVWHKANGTGATSSTTGFSLNSTAVPGYTEQDYSSIVTSTTFDASAIARTGNGTCNTNGGTYVAYLFAHNAGGFGASGSDNVISCGSFTTDASGNGTFQNLGYEPQWMMVKSITSSEDWVIADTMRGLYGGTASSNVVSLNPNAVGTEGVAGIGANISATGFTGFGSANKTYIYIAIRRGPMKTPTDATKVFTPTVYTGTNVDNRLVNTTIAPDMVMIRQRDDTVVAGMYTGARLTGQEYLLTGSTAIGATDADSFDAQIVSTVEYGNAFSSMSGVWVGNDATRKFNVSTAGSNQIVHAFKRAPGFFDVVCFNAPSSGSLTISHNLGVTPELIIHKRRATAEAWLVYSTTTGADNYLRLNTDAASTAATGMWPNITSSSWDATAGKNVTGGGGAYVAYLFASLAGVSKVGTYTGNGSTQTINCGFTAGARYVLIKRTDSTGNWQLFDTARGIDAAGDALLMLNSTSADNSGNDLIDPDNSGFVVVDGNTNTLNATYIYLAIA